MQWCAQVIEASGSCGVHRLQSTFVVVVELQVTFGTVNNLIYSTIGFVTIGFGKSQCRVGFLRQPVCRVVGIGLFTETPIRS